MKILGINDSHNASACLLVDGKLVAAVQEERLRRVKNWSGFPVESIQCVLKLTATAAQQVDRIAFLGHSVASPALLGNLRNAFRLARIPLAPILWSYGHLPDLYSLANARTMRRQRCRLLTESGLSWNRAHFVDHHLAHAASAYYGWGRMDRTILVLTADGSGDGLSASVNVGDSGHLTRLAAVETSASLGILYALATAALGLTPVEHESKVMGLAPYAPLAPVQALQQRLAEQFEFDDNQGLRWRRARHQPDIRISYPALKAMWEEYRFDVIAGGVQAFLEEWLCTWVRNCIRSTGIPRVALAGGLFMNVKANKAVSELDCVDELFIFPSGGDESGSIGAAMLVHYLEGGVSPEPLNDLYLGPEYTDPEILLALSDLRHPGVQWKLLENVPEAVGRLLASGEIVAYFGGRMEFGARALGNRSILAHPGNLEHIRTLNESIKGRDFWMPFAPALLDRRASEYILNPKAVPAPYMVLAFDTTSRYREIAAAIHPWDRTARPQIVTSEQNPMLHRILSEFERLTGCGALLNTSFNLHGEPIVMTPRDGVDVFMRSRLKHMVMGSYLVQKATPDSCFRP